MCSDVDTRGVSAYFAAMADDRVDLLMPSLLTGLGAWAFTGEAAYFLVGFAAAYVGLFALLIVAAAIAGRAPATTRSIGEGKRLADESTPTTA